MRWFLVLVTLAACGSEAPPEAADAAAPADARVDAALRPEPVMLAAAQGRPGHVVLDDAYVYWANDQAGQEGIARVAKAGGAVEPVLAGATVWRMAIDDASVYWIEGDSARVQRVAKAGGTPEELPAMAATAQGIAVDDTHAFVTTGEGTATGTIYRVAKDGATPGEQLYGFAPSAFFGVAADASYVYWITGQGAVYRAGKDGADAMILGAQQGDVYDIATDDASVYWSILDFGRIARTDKAGSGIVSVVTENARPYELDVHDGRIYWTEPSANTILAIAVDGTGGAEIVYAAEPAPASLAVDASGIYYADLESGVWRLPLP